MSASVDHVIGIAASQVGYFARPGTVSKYGQWYGMPREPWCAMFVSWVADQAGATDIIPRHAYTPSGAAWFKSQGRWHTDIRGIKKGDILYFDFPGAPNRISHVAFAASDYNHAGGYVETIEGNTSGPGGDQRNGGALLRKRRNQWIVGYGRPNYGGSGFRVLQKGSSGDDVRNVQQHLINLGYNLGPYGADGDFGDATDAAVRQFQRDRGLEDDGIFGPNTAGQLFGGANPQPTPPTPPSQPVFHGTPGVHTGRLTADGNLELVLDGDPGGGTIGRLQQVMGTPIDYVISEPSTVWVAIQHYLNSVVAATHIRNLTGRSALTADGLPGPKTYKVLQFWLYNRYAPAVLGRSARASDFDGVAGGETWKLFQYALNNARAGSRQF